ncbi:tRNA lysidine(34) synthetase TilS [Phenylobacterium sp.]|uniref:tRNA lysidine(34) synthetase TilS n=1 Tax=Phenylobacterium sp. TaxID=1871053 RepID=UPI002730F67B|nr:tRNA lysidine(34) synthetase TilS [Phenylobacterium sp.]MDP1618298.1 tRNA lysidine(34) synthetase TilS [Phenylobacterium sp.]MDP1987220.1 tRNA lysidine(34) synthetase TilS [Phenylobacterium sp.]
MRLAQTPFAVEGPPGQAALSHHLRRDSSAPLAVAYSGGGDSLALLLSVQAWAQTHGRQVIALHVDHRLQAASSAWADHCAAVAARLGVAFQHLVWTGPKPETGLPAAARAARHRLLAQAARDLGARVLLLGHTLDDVEESRLMRSQGASAPEPRTWAPSPAWPVGRGLFVLRPLLGERRAALRAYLSHQPHAWIEDPANENLAYARTRARVALAEGGVRDLPPPRQADIRALVAAAHIHPLGAVSWPRDVLAAQPDAIAVRALSIACLCAAGSVRPPRTTALARLLARMRTAEVFTATLAGARIEAGAQSVMIVREAGEAARGGLIEQALTPGPAQVWDGRFEIVTSRQGLRIRALAGLAAQLAPAEHRALAALPPSLRPTLPAVVDEAGQVACAVLQPMGGVEIRSLVTGRLRAAAGLVAQEPAA